MGAEKLPVRVLRYRDANVPRQQGEVARLRVLKGPDQGLTIVITQSSVVLGRGEEVDVGVSDLKISRKHVQIHYTPEGWLITDLGSSNGIFYQGQYLRKVNVQSGDHFTLGETMFEFLLGSEQTRVLTSPFKNAQDLQKNDEQLASQRARVQLLSQPAKIVDRAASVKKNSSRTLILVAALAAAYFFMEEEASMPTSKKKVKKGSEEETGVASQVERPQVDPEVEKTSEMYYKAGFREFTQNNFLRAKAQFELSLQVNPSHGLARKYLKQSEHEISLQVKKVIQSAQKEESAGRLKSAKGLYETAQRLLYFDRTSPDFVECEEAIRRIDKKGGL